MWKIADFTGKIHYKWPCSIDANHYRRVNLRVLGSFIRFRSASYHGPQRPKFPTGHVPEIRQRATRVPGTLVFVISRTCQLEIVLFWETTKQNSALWESHEDTKQTCIRSRLQHVSTSTPMKRCRFQQMDSSDSSDLKPEA